MLLSVIDELQDEQQYIEVSNDIYRKIIFKIRGGSQYKYDKPVCQQSACRKKGKPAPFDKCVNTKQQDDGQRNKQIVGNCFYDADGKAEKLPELQALKCYFIRKSGIAECTPAGL